jgi:hypothetical protein
VKRVLRGWLIGTSTGMALLLTYAPMPASAAQESPSKAVSDATTTATREGSAHVAVAYASMGTPGKVIEDATVTSGKESIAIGNERVSILLVNGIVYFLGNVPGLESYFGFPKAAASAFSGRWISVTSTDQGYQPLVSDVTLTSALKGATPVGTLSKGMDTTVSGHSVTSVSGGGPAGQGKMVLFLAAKGPRLPVEAVVGVHTGKKGSGEIVTFSHWGEEVNVTVPSVSIPISSLSSRASIAG